jgi:putative PIN family toxin of toxin-antitoxin system
VRLVLDTKVWISGFLKPDGPPAQLIKLARRDEHTLLLSPQLIDELVDVVHRPKLQRYFPPGVAVGLAATVMEIGEFTPQPLPDIDASPDPDDNFLLAMARVGAADLIVSGDHRGLLALREFEGISIVPPNLALQLITT